MRSVAIALAALVSGCGGETVLRIEIPSPGASPSPVGLRVSLLGSGITAAPRTLAPVQFPGVVVVKGVPDSAATVCVEVDGLDDVGHTVVGGSTTVAVAAHKTTTVSVPLSDSFDRCSALSFDMAVPPPFDLAGADLAQPPPPDGGVAICPAGSIFCDDFESGTINKWTSSGFKYDLGSIDVQSGTVLHGSFALHTNATGAPGMSNIAEVEYDFPPQQPPIAVRANFYSPQPLGSFTIVMALYDDTVHGFSIGGDSDSTWVVTEDQATGGAPDHHSDMVPASGGQWHCLEMVVDAAGQVTAYVDNHALIGPFPRITPVGYTTLLVGIDRTVVADTNVFADDVALGPSRLYCPQ